jgi:hypothetical protein
MNITSIPLTEHQHCRVRTREAFDNASDRMGLVPHDVCDQQRSSSTILVILHYLLKNNITFMGVMCRGNRGGATASSQRVLHVASRPRLEDRLR